VFVLFGSFGLIGLQMSTRRASVAAIALQIALAGGFAIGYAGLFMAQRFRYVPVLVVVQILVERFVGQYIGASSSLVGQPEALQRQLTLLGAMSMLGILVAYSLMINFLRVEGRKYVQARTEIALASEIHSSLVPVCSVKHAGYEIYGASLPSGDVGGDLVDVVQEGDEWIGYVADVSGHGVQSGVLMAMFKAALRGQIASGGSLATMLGEVHRTLFSLKLRNMFITVGALRGAADGRVHYALAGHPPILHHQKASGAVREYASLDPPLGIMEEQQFSESEIRCESGDLLLVLTDGLTEVFDKKGNEMGMDVLKKKLQMNAELPLVDLFGQLRKTAADFGLQADDQTLLLVRYRD
jgi:serine phosphatase RsbU (regulator of sigma subunit)